MICKNCGQELKENEAICSVCSTPVSDTNKIQVTYENRNTELVDPPVIMEAHTFIDEESFAKKVNVLDQNTPQTNNQLDEMWNEPAKKSPMIWIFVIGIIIIIGLVGYFVIYPNIKIESKIEKRIIANFTSEEWTSGQFKIEGEFYQLNQPFSQFSNNDWQFVDDEILLLVLDPEEKTETYFISKSIDGGQIKVQIRNQKKKENTVKDSYVWSVEVDTTKEENEFAFILPGNIKKGCTIEEITAKYGDLTEKFISKDDNNKTTTYHYSKDNQKNLDLIIKDEEGLVAFHYYFS
ncbi:MAG: zinc ribbon domain-containing protein [Bacilli bacterium]|nr:zinc ribbon domain-containing protein [Bacilli bacterium]